MDRTASFRRLLERRLYLEIAGGMLAVVPIGLVAACGGSVDIVGDSGGTGSGGAGGATASSTDVATSTTTGPGSTSTASTTSSTSVTSTATSTSASGATSSVSSTGSFMECGMTQKCFQWLVNGPCPAKEEALDHFSQCSDSCWINSVDSDPMQTGDQCCYAVSSDFCGVGRPFLIDGRARTASARRGQEAGWSEGDAPGIDALPSEARAASARGWREDALLEHASIASFARFSMELLAVGAPADLVEAAHHAALDEVRHARLCFTLASAYLGEALEPAPFPFGGAVPIAADRAAIAASAFREGCVGETLAAVLAAEQLAQATDPAVRAALAVIVDDESRHAGLAFRTVAWALRTGGAEVRAAVEEALAEVTRELGARLPEQGSPALDPHGAALAAHGRLDRATVQSLRLRALEDVVLPCARSLLAKQDGERARPVIAGDSV